LRIPENRWNVATVETEAVEDHIPALASRLGVPRLVAHLLWLRDLRTMDAARAFLSPRLADLVPPTDLPDMDRAADRLAHAVRSGEPVGIFGDYDVDGMTGTALLVRFLQLAGAETHWSIPNRRTEGYGMPAGAVERLGSRGVKLIVTVDNGIVAHEAVRRANTLGIDVIVTDHHLPSDELPPAHAVVDPHRRDADGTNLDLCGCALAFKLAWAVADRLRNLDAGREAAFRAFLRDAVGLVALATVSDVVPLRDENRILVSSGLAALRGSEHPGMRALLEIARVGALPLTTEDVAFRIAPRLNAAGRLSKPEIVIELLTATDYEEARRLGRTLHDANVERRRIEQKVLKQAVVQADEILADDERHSLVVHGEGWHRGVIGIVAARLVDLHQRPTVVIGFEGEGGRGSCRTPSAVDLHQALGRCDDHLAAFGGHASAAGIEIERSRVDRFVDAFESAVRAQTDRELPVRTIEVDAEASVEDFDLDTVEALQRLAPFGPTNPQPVFLVRGATVAGRARLMGQNDAHLTFSLKRPGGAVRVVGFRMADRFELASGGDPLDLVVAPMLNDWKGVRTAELRLVDVRVSAEVPQTRVPG
jgi:single-stranded-DNA-specific exonuclease